MLKYDWLTLRLHEPFGTECVEWPFGKNSDGYGVVNRNAKKFKVSHVVLGARPIGMEALHSCDNPPCFNPNHLRWGTKRENQLDAMARGQHVSHSGEACGNSKLRNLDIHYIFALKSLGYSQVAISKEFNVSSQQISRILRGEQRRLL